MSYEVRAVTGWWELVLAFVVFLASHAVPVRPVVKDRLVRGLGRRGYLIVYVAVSLLALGWLISEAGRAPHVPLWPWRPWQLWVPNLAMPVVCLLLAYGTAVPNPLSFAGRNTDAFDPDAPDIAGVSRHPLLLAFVLWAGAHVVPNGNLAHVLIFGGLGGFALIGMVMLDRRLRRRLGPDEWRRLAHRTSGVPLAALVQGRWRPRGRPSLARAGIAVVLWVGLIGLHQGVIGVSPLPR